MNDHLGNMGGVKYVLDVTAIVTTGAVLLDYAPKVAALLSILWLGIQIYSWAEKRWWRKS